MSALETAKIIWDRLSKVNEGVSTQRDSRVDVLRNLFNRFKRLDNENVQQTFDRLTDISNELQALGATDPTDKPDEDNDDYAPTYCFMAKGAKVLKYTSSESSENESDENLKPSYSKLAKC